MAKPYKRTKVIIDNLQYRLLIVGIIYFAAVVFIFACGVFVPVILQLDQAGISSPEVQEAAHQFLVLHERVWTPLTFAFVLLVVHSIVTSHRIAGPLYRIRGELQTVGGGDLSGKITLRKDDYLKKDADTANAMIASLRERIDRLQNHSRDARADLAALERAAQTGSMDAVTQQTDKLAANIGRWVRVLDEFKTTRDPSGPGVDAVESDGPKMTEETVGSAS